MAALGVRDACQAASSLSRQPMRPGDDSPLGGLAVNSDAWLTLELNIEHVIQAFDLTQTDQLAVVDVD
jgi:hypothetical protein